MVAFVPPSGNEKPLGPWTNKKNSHMRSRTEIVGHVNTKPTIHRIKKKYVFFRENKSITK